MTTTRPAILAIAILLGAFPSEGAGQQAGSDEGAAVAGAAATPEDGWSLFGYAADRRRVIPAFWRTHPFDQKFPAFFYTMGVGVQTSGWLAGVFKNSYDDLSFLAGIERSWLASDPGWVRYGLGYRAGLLSGYDERLASWADDMPILPFVGFQAWIQVGRFSVDAFYVYRAITLEGSVGF